MSDDFTDDLLNQGYTKGRLVTIDEYMNKLLDFCVDTANDCSILECPFCRDLECKVISIAEQLKEQKNDRNT